MIEYLEQNQNIPLLRNIFFYNSLEINMSCRYYREYFTELAIQSGFQIEKKIKEEEEPEQNNTTTNEDTTTNNDETTEEKPTKVKKEKKERETIVFTKLTMEEKVEKYNKIPIICEYQKIGLEMKQIDNSATREDNEILSKYYFMKMIDINNTPLENQAFMYYDLWCESTRKKIIQNKYYYNNYDISELLHKETHDILCTEKMENKSNKIHVIKNIESILEINHNEIDTKVITQESIKKSFEYLFNNQTKIYEIFGFRNFTKSKDNIEEKRRLQYCFSFIDRIYRDFFSYTLKGNTFDKKKDKFTDYKLYSTMEKYNFSYIFNKNQN